MDFLPTKFFGEYVTVANCSSDEKIRWQKCTSDEKIRWPTGPLTKGDGGEWISGKKFGGERGSGESCNTNNKANISLAELN